MQDTNNYTDCNNITTPIFDINNLESNVGRSGIDGDVCSLRFNDNVVNSKQEYDFIIVGAGIQGCAIACHLLNVNPKLDILLIDENDYLCEQFYTRTRNVNQRTLRSPYHHHIAPDGDLQLLDYARLHSYYLSTGELDQVELSLTGQRSIVPLDVFWGHTKHTLVKYRIQNITVKDDVRSFKKLHDIYILKSENNEYRAKKILICTGAKKFIPSGLEEFAKRYSDDVFHAFSYKTTYIKGSNVLVVGSGLTAATLLKELTKNNDVSWLIRSNEIYKCTDVLPKYFRTEGVAEIGKFTEEERDRVIQRENKGSIMPEFKTLLRSLENNGAIKVYRNTTIKNIVKNNEGLLIELSNEYSCFYDKVILATGLEVNLPIFKNNPIRLNNNLEVIDYPGVYILGQYAEIVIGPAAKNIDGYRIAAKKIITHCLNLNDQAYNPKGKYAIS